MPFQVNHPILFGLAALVILFVLFQSIFFLRKAWKRALELGLSSQKLREMSLSTAVFTLAPAVAILIGLITLSKFLGLPLPWLRLSVLGALTYELPAATAEAEAMHTPINSAVTDPAAYNAIAWVMTLGILSGILLILFFQKKMAQGMHKMKAKDERWSAILMDSLFLGMISAFLGMIFKDLNHGLAGWIPVFVLLFSAMLMLICGLFVKLFKWRWLENYAMPISMLGAMAFAIPLTAWIG